MNIRTRAAVYICTVFSLLLIMAAGVSAQQKVSRHFPAGKNVRIDKVVNVIDMPSLGDLVIE